MSFFENFKLSIIGNSMNGFPYNLQFKSFVNSCQGTYRMCSFFLKSK